MRTDDPVFLQRIEQLEAIAAGLRMACGFPPLNAGPEVTASRAPRWCPRCPGVGFQSRADLEHHIANCPYPKQAA